MTEHRASLAAVHAELRDALEQLNFAKRQFEKARLYLEASHARHRAASLEVINRCIEIKQISAEATAARHALANAACERRSHHSNEGTPHDQPGKRPSAP